MDASKTGLVIKEQTMTQEINLTSDLALYQATQRRVLAMDLTNLASYEKKNGWIACLQSSPNRRRLAFRRFFRPSFLELIVKEDLPRRPRRKNEYKTEGREGAVPTKRHETHPFRTKRGSPKTKLKISSHKRGSIVKKLT